MTFIQNLDLIKRLINNGIMKTIGEEKNIAKRSAEDTKKRILDVSLKLFAQNGFENTTTREICEKAKVNINLIYYYFGGKRELHDAIMGELVKKQAAFVSDYIDYNCDLEKLEYEEKIKLLTLFTQKMIDFFYNYISKEQVSFFLRVQQDPRSNFKLPPHMFLSKLLSSITGKKPDSKEVVFRLLFLMSQITFPRLVPLFSLKILGQNDFDEEDIKIIKENNKKYIKMTYLNNKESE